LCFVERKYIKYNICVRQSRMKWCTIHQVYLRKIILVSWSVVSGDVDGGCWVRWGEAVDAGQWHGSASVLHKTTGIERQAAGQRLVLYVKPMLDCCCYTSCLPADLIRLRVLQGAAEETLYDENCNFCFTFPALTAQVLWNAVNLYKSGKNWNTKYVFANRQPVTSW